MAIYHHQPLEVRELWFKGIWFNGTAGEALGDSGVSVAVKTANAKHGSISLATHAEERCACAAAFEAVEDVGGLIIVPNGWGIRENHMDNAMNSTMDENWR